MHLCSGAPPSEEGELRLVRDPREVERQLKRRQKNRAAAQRSRQKHTDKADELHQQHERLEKDNRALRKEIWSLQAEVKWWVQTLEEHVCLMAVVPASAQTHPARWSQPEPATQGSPPGQRASIMVQTLPRPLPAPASPSAEATPSSSPEQALDPPGLVSTCSLCSPPVPFLVTSPPAGSPPGAATTQTQGASSLRASPSVLGPGLPAPPQLPACLLWSYSHPLPRGAPPALAPE
ncbi:basic leucine zipper transcriptional factor ATF-like 2 [Dromiciops gliroides]|uniref:basic leucine zipper transcriptional factor ATF-like 2 n=1 Tax=Dromiciops gliroides TaxID=33562 RepID=UPI001CC567EE|nr:basic leucine zipper transcriptional factor ATF-like 2 [Dromiciops gliroides]